MSNTDGEDTQKVSLGELLLNAGTRIVDLEKQSNDQVEIITHLDQELASLREQLKEKDAEVKLQPANIPQTNICIVYKVNSDSVINIFYRV